MEKELAHIKVKNKIRVHAQFFVLNKLPAPVTTMQIDPSTKLTIPVTEDYQYLPGTEYACNFNGLGIRPEEFVLQWQELGKSIWKNMQDKGVTI